MRPLDLIMTKRRDIPIDDPMDILSEGITWVTNGGPSHVRVYVSDDLLWEVTFPRCRFGSIRELDKQYVQEYQMEIGRNKNLPYPLPKEIFDRALAEMKRLEGSYYDIGELFDQLLEIIGLEHGDSSNPDLFVCSSGAEHVFRKIGYGFRPEHPLVSPMDIIKSPYYITVPWGEGR